MEKCPFCLSETRPGDNFCLNCGNRLVPATPSSMPSQAQPGMGDATLAASDEWGASGPASGSTWSDAGATIVGSELSNYDPDAATLRAETIDQPARFIIRSDTGEVVDEYALKKVEVSIGRASSSDIPLLRDKLTSRRHATVRYENGHYVLRDERSANGTFVNGQQLGEMSPHVLQEGDRVGIGEHELIFHTYASPSTHVEDLPTIAVPFNPQEVTYRTREDAGATLLASGDELGVHSKENGSSADVPSPAPATPKAEYAAPAAPVAATNNASQPSAPPAAAPVPEPSIPVATSYNVPTPPAPVEPVSVPASAPAPAPKTPTSTPSISAATSTPSISAATSAAASSPSSRADANMTFNRLTSIAQPPLPDLTTLMAAVSSLDSQVAALQDQFHATQEAMRNHDAEVAQAANQLRTSVRRVADRMDSTIADVARNREALSWTELSQLLQDVMENPRDIEYVTKLARKARELNKIFQIYQNVLNTMAECNSLLRGLIGEDR